MCKIIDTKNLQGKWSGEKYKENKFPLAWNISERHCGLSSQKASSCVLKGKNTVLDKTEKPSGND